jgi:succinate dehydrogenase hydrophobic anchor subunit
MDKQDNKPTTLEERLIGAFISAIAMACTIAALSFVFFILAAKGRYAGTHLFMNSFFQKSLCLLSLLLLSWDSFCALKKCWISSAPYGEPILHLKLTQNTNL